ncbi:hypothetical protein H2198_006640 [Neophaeococcomyces mojaviensis]|uniref:Uncharacterized protein n=1 Tax=Neophaeococcomyces mojaviensis TaxID=3383035 RepID=A0ACC3A2S0_9EURO|nr:hypothetical protein H2198_006640 [Knufia sp. JES_112]
MPIINMRPRRLSFDSHTGRFSENIPTYEGPEGDVQSTAKGIVISVSSPQLAVGAVSPENTPTIGINEGTSNSTQKRQDNKERRVRVGKQGGKKQRPTFECSVCQRQFTPGA